jgi:hypothetical protein
VASIHTYLIAQREKAMNRHETLAKISYYEWMLESMTLKAAHEMWIRDQIEDLQATIPVLREKEGLK